MCIGDRFTNNDAAQGAGWIIPPQKLDQDSDHVCGVYYVPEPMLDSGFSEQGFRQALGSIPAPQFGGGGSSVVTGTSGSGASTPSLSVMNAPRQYTHRERVNEVEVEESRWITADNADLKQMSDRQRILRRHLLAQGWMAPCETFVESQASGEEGPPSISINPETGEETVLEPKRKTRRGKRRKGTTASSAASQVGDVDDADMLEGGATGSSGANADEAALGADDMSTAALAEAAQSGDDGEYM